ncbi:MAG: hypothetical protein IBX50_20315 [Marinospirillum sp.]|uniref:hypothetical protein n=1 Tax=Marinospirillum sp. TaxID=2183934 RepID=UPI001A06A8BB|nr:hypothetical protein [Marinospirillum sp.]MBE0509029.1 hypothetical protein [Marinospirillum sp.]
MHTERITAEPFKRKAVALTDEMIQYAQSLQSDKQRAIDFLKRAGILNKEGKLAKEYAA